MSKVTLHLKDRSSVDLDDKRILCNDISLPGEKRGGRAKLWVCGNEYGALGAVWATHEQDALDELVDADLGAGLLVDQKYADEYERDYGESLPGLGNASEPADLEHAWCSVVVFETPRDLNLLYRFARASEVGATFLSEV